ncbi:WD domain-containing protein [Colletotrichum higginsianum]|nr:WD domain-containing protein [Colletotrichum higginsianum]
MFDDNISPRSEIATNGLGDAPELEQLSDIAYFQWLYACREKNIHPANIRLIFRAKITYAPSFELIALALSDAGYGRVPGWDRRATFGMDTRPGLAILGSTHGSGAALFLIQHKRILGLKKITQVTVWGDNGGFALDSDAERVALNLRFVVTNA